MERVFDGIIGDWLPHKSKCRCTDCQLDRAHQAVRDLQKQNDALREALREAMPLIFNGVPSPSHEGSCGPDSQCDGVCSDIANCAQIIIKVRKALERNP